MSWCCRCARARARAGRAAAGLVRAGASPCCTTAMSAVVKRCSPSCTRGTSKRSWATASSNTDGDARPFGELFEREELLGRPASAAATAAASGASVASSSPVEHAVDQRERQPAPAQLTDARQSFDVLRSVPRDAALHVRAAAGAGAFGRSESCRPTPRPGGPAPRPAAARAAGWSSRAPILGVITPKISIEPADQGRCAEPVRCSPDRRALLGEGGGALDRVAALEHGHHQLDGAPSSRRPRAARPPRVRADGVAHGDRGVLADARSASAIASSTTRSAATTRFTRPS